MGIHSFAAASFDPPGSTHLPPAQAQAGPRSKPIQCEDNTTQPTQHSTGRLPSTQFLLHSTVNRLNQSIRPSALSPFLRVPDIFPVLSSPAAIFSILRPPLLPSVSPSLLLVLPLSLPITDFTTLQESVYAPDEAPPPRRHFQVQHPRPRPRRDIPSRPPNRQLKEKRRRSIPRCRARARPCSTPSFPGRPSITISPQGLSAATYRRRTTRHTTQPRPPADRLLVPPRQIRTGQAHHHFGWLARPSSRRPSP
jgi:hypothetical protein